MIPVPDQANVACSPSRTTRPTKRTAGTPGVIGAESLDVVVELEAPAEVFDVCAALDISGVVLALGPVGLIGSVGLAVAVGSTPGAAEVVAVGGMTVGELGATSTLDGKVVIEGATEEVVVTSVSGLPLGPFAQATVLAANAPSATILASRTATWVLTSGTRQPPDQGL